MGVALRDHVGHHLLVDFFGVDPKRLQSRDRLMAAIRKALKAAGFRIVRSAGAFKFRGGGRGVTGFVLLAQSHAAFHSYPEYGYMALDIYSCGGRDPKPVARKVSRFLRPKHAKWFLRRRGNPSPR